MQFNKTFKGFGLSAILVALCAFQANAAIERITLGNANGADLPLNSLSASPAVPADPQNPNQFPVYFAESAIGEYGFLLDGSEWSNMLVRRIEEAHTNGTNITLYFDGNVSIKTTHNMWSLTGQGTARKILYISTNKVN